MLFFGVVEVVGEVLEEVVVEDFGDAGEQGSVDCGACEDVIDVATVAGDLPCKPGDCMVLWLLVEYFLYFSADMHFLDFKFGLDITKWRQKKRMSLKTVVHSQLSRPSHCPLE